MTRGLGFDRYSDRKIAQPFAEFLIESIRPFVRPHIRRGELDVPQGPLALGKSGGSYIAGHISGSCQPPRGIGNAIGSRFGLADQNWGERRVWGRTHRLDREKHQHAREVRPNSLCCNRGR